MKEKKQSTPDKKSVGLINYFINRLAQALKGKKKSA
jgi:hypothetical protein